MPRRPGPEAIRPHRFGSGPGGRPRFPPGPFCPGRRSAFRKGAYEIRARRSAILGRFSVNYRQILHKGIWAGPGRFIIPGNHGGKAGGVALSGCGVRDPLRPGPAPDRGPLCRPGHRNHRRSGRGRRNPGGRGRQDGGGRVLIGQTFHRLVRPRRNGWGPTVPIHRIRPADVEAAPPIEAVLPELADFCRGAVIVGHKVGFDRAFLKRAGFPAERFRWVDIGRVEGWLEIGRASCREECRSRWSPYH